MKWEFRELTKEDTLKDESHLQFFRDDALESSVDALVREDLQNRLDAKAKNESYVEVRYRFSSDNERLEAESRWMKGLPSHLDALESRREIGHSIDPTAPMGFLTIEDFNTRGLQGEPLTFQDPPPPTNSDDRNDFFWFIRNVARSGKGGGDRGRWGLGKIVYPASSQIRAFFAYTVRRNDGRQMLIGRSVLAVHGDGDGKYFDSEGYFGRFDDPHFAKFATPEEDPDVLTQFRSDFRLERTENQPGLSIVIPFPQSGIESERLSESVIHHYFWEILKGRLVVRVEDGQRSTRIARDSIDEVIAQLDITDPKRAALKRMVDFARCCDQFDSTNSNRFWRLPLPPENTRPAWTRIEEKFDPENKLDDARTAFRNEELVGFSVPVRVQTKNGDVDETASFQVFLQRSSDQFQPGEHFIRDGLTITGQRFLSENGVQAMILIVENRLADLLGDSENPAHTKWLQNTKHFQGKYHYGPSILSYVKNAANSLAGFLGRVDEGRDEDLLQHLFSVPIQDEEGKRRRPGAHPGEETTPPDIGEIRQQTYYLQMEKKQDGFTIRPHPKATSAPTEIRIRLAYETLRGNAFKLHHPGDFDLRKPTNISFDTKNLELAFPDVNRIEARVTGPDFSLNAMGFDQHRDLIVDARPVPPNPNAAAEP